MLHVIFIDHGHELVAGVSLSSSPVATDIRFSSTFVMFLRDGHFEVKTACGHPRRAARDVSEPDPLQSGTVPGRIVPVRSTEDSLYARLQQIVQRLTETKGHYANLADTVCSDETWAVREEGQCWNGISVGQ
ncbi:uncharacterized protein TNCV_1870821 [Trichonephila clavipes]|nr:uncharacterized protein TNCV_1870821 [Trichonephila clavipes]